MKFPWQDEAPAADAPSIKKVLLEEPPRSDSRFYFVYVVNRGGVYKGLPEVEEDAEYCSLLPFRGWKDGKWILGNAGKSGNISPADLKRRVCELRAYVKNCISVSLQHSSHIGLVRQVFDERLDIWAKTIDNEEVCSDGDS